VTHTHVEAGADVPDRTQNLTRREIESAAEEMVIGYPYAARYEILESRITIGFFNPAIG